MAIALILVSCALVGKRPSPSPSPSPPSSSFELWKKDFGKSYATEAEEAMASANYDKASALIDAHNTQPLAFRLGHNQFSDMSPSQFRDAMLTPDLGRREAVLGAATKTKIVHKKGDYDGLLEMLPQTVDWVGIGAVSDAVDDQGRCAGSWAFAAAAAMESAHRISTGMRAPLVRLSRQQLLDCNVGEGALSNRGCRGGLPEQAFTWSAAHRGLCAESTYPYLASRGLRYECRAVACERVAMAGGYVSVEHLDEIALQDAVAQTPVAALVSASHPVFQLYSGGVFDHPLTSDGPLDHVVLIVGYGTSDAGVEYWKVRNSWGARWGVDGYMLLRRNVNMAGIASYPSYPIGLAVPPPQPVIHAENVTREVDSRIRSADLVPQPTVYDGACHKPREGDVRLDAYPSGHALMFYDGEWHTVCEERSNSNFATVVCKMLGYRRAEYQGGVSASAKYPMVSSPRCMGAETSLMDCKFDPTYKNQVCSTYRNLVASYVSCADGELNNYTLNCGYMSPESSAKLGLDAPARRQRSASERAPAHLWSAAVALVASAAILAAAAVLRRVRPQQHATLV